MPPLKKLSVVESSGKLALLSGRIRGKFSLKFDHAPCVKKSTFFCLHLPVRYTYDVSAIFISSFIIIRRGGRRASESKFPLLPYNIFLSHSLSFCFFLVSSGYLLSFLRVWLPRVTWTHVVLSYSVDGTWNTAFRGLVAHPRDCPSKFFDSLSIVRMARNTAARNAMSSRL